MDDLSTKSVGDDNNKSGADSNRGPLKRDHSSEPDSGAGDFQPRKKRNRDVDRPEKDVHIAVEDYSVGWVCALPLEMAAAKGMLDQVHPNLAQQDPADHNSYILGQVQGHNVVIACLPAGIYGTTPAATVAKDLLRTFKSIRFGLMVGIGGGVPSRKNDIRLGDIVVSQPVETSGGVIQYDRGKTVQEGEFQRTGSLNTPPQVLLAALGRLQADHIIEGSRIPQFVSELINKSRDNMKKRFSHQGALHDYLFQAEYDHVDPDSTCDECDHKQMIQREDRDNTYPVVHYGNIASGNQVIKHGKTRDKLSKELGVLCFEMEAAGLQDFPCLVIRGVCDYADSHKNKRWQEYAAATAAAFAKELLSVIPPDRVLQEKPIPQSGNQMLIPFADPRLHEIVKEQTQKQEARYESQKQADCHRTFKTSTYEQFKNINPDRVPGTCKWVLGHPLYQAWQQSRHNDLLWISADPGCGKSVLAKSLIDGELHSTNHHTACYFFFKDNDDQNSLATALCALLHQLFNSQPRLIRHATMAFEKNGEKLQTEVDELWRILVAAATDDEAVNVTCVLDALDECCLQDRRRTIRLLTNFYNRQLTSTRKSQLKFLVTSRPYQDIESEFRDIPEPQTIRLAGEESNADISEEINLVIRHKVATAGDKLGMSQEVQNVLQEKLFSVPHRTYLWLHLVMDEVSNSPVWPINGFIKTINTLPTKVEDAYEKILGRLNSNQQREAQTLLHIVMAARRPLTLLEMAVAFQLAPDSPTIQAHEDLDLNSTNLKLHIRQLCGLFVFINDDRIYLIHQTAKEFLVAQDIPASLTDGCWKHSLYIPDSETIMTQICVQYLSFRDIPDGRFRVEGRKPGIDTTQNPFLGYSAIYWSSHSRGANHPTEEGLQKQILRLYDMQNQRFRTWFSMFWQTNYQYQSRDGLNSVHLAALNGHDEVLLRLLPSDNDALNSRDNAGRTPLIWGSSEGHDNIVRMLLDKGADVNAQGGRYGNALQAASFKGHDKIVQMLLDKDADVNAQGGDYVNALYIASEEGHDDIVQMLLNKGADVNAHGGEYGNALQAASQGGHNNIVQMLLDKGADVNARGGVYGNALQAASEGGHDNIVQMLLDKGADVNAQGGEYGNALQAASERGHDNIVQMLLDKGADVNAHGGEYGNALQAASERGHDNIVRMLLDKGADVNAQGGRYGNALQATSQGGHNNIVQMLLDKGADVNARGGEYGNALYIASEKGHDDIVQMLLDKGADVNAQGGEYGNALQAASERGHDNIVQMLLDKGADVGKDKNNGA
ncbi:Ankyrin repeat domain-containing protein 50-like protein 3 [Colletotrichum chrysophilum]|uniref:Ankyrin repeat domain-containing protein 50-like protein 3 n=1 Tax=Colletotrichum chrysophilum TaxID=1836956 RepID=A0AAD9E9Q6_9PEZI|nr:Ankyrin repeat domain-containing protein 50-like protein 3 [Colletotrichum chrysophilum]